LERDVNIPHRASSIGFVTPVYSRKHGYVTPGTGCCHVCSERCSPCRNTTGHIAALRSLIATSLRLAIFETMGGGEGDRHHLSARYAGADRWAEGCTRAAAEIRGRNVLGFQSIAQVRVR